jgi:threonine/homoserine efflux transporter RhtA
MPPHAYFVCSAVFHYHGPAFAVLLFVRVEPLGVAWLRIVNAAAVFALLVSAMSTAVSRTGNRIPCGNADAEVVAPPDHPSGSV